MGISAGRLAIGESRTELDRARYQAPSLLAPVYKSLGREAEAEADATRRRALQLAEKHVELHPDDAWHFTFGRASCANWLSPKNESNPACH